MKSINLINKLFILLFYRNDIQLLTMPGKKDRDFFIMQAVFGTMVISLFMGVFLSGLYIFMGASDGILGYIPIMPNIAGILMIFMASFTERVKNVKKAVIVLNFISKTLLFSAVWIPLFVSWDKAPYIMLPLTFIGFVVNTVMGILVNSWFVDTIEISIRGKYMGTRQSFTLIVSAVLPVIAGKFLDGFIDKYFAFCVIYTAAWLFSFLESFSLFKITTRTSHESQTRKQGFSRVFLVPLKNKKFMSFMIIQILFHLAWFLSMTFAQVYEIKYMQISYTYLTIMGSAGAIIQMLLYPVWGKIMDRFGSDIVMRCALFMFMVHTLIYFFMLKGNAHILLLILNINGAVLSPAWVLSTFSERFTTIPKEGRTVYDSFFTTILGSIILLAPTIGNLLRNVIIKLEITDILYAEFRILFLISFISLLILNLILLYKNNKNTKMDKEKEIIRNITAKLPTKRKKKAA